MPLEHGRDPESARDFIGRSLRNPEVADDRRRDHVRIVTGPQPYRHAHFAADQFFHTDPAVGVVRNVYGQRVLRVTENFLRTLAQALVDRAPDSAANTLYRIGQAWGEASLRDFIPRIEREYEVEFDKLGMGVMLESWWWQYRAAGWGVWHCDFRHAHAGAVMLDLFDSATAHAAGQSGAVACSLYAGLYSAVFSRLAQRELGCVELACAAKGDPRCRFLIAVPARVAEAAAQRDAGTAVDEIVSGLASSAS